MMLDSGVHFILTLSNVYTVLMVGRGVIRGSHKRLLVAHSYTKAMPLALVLGFCPCRCFAMCVGGARTNMCKVVYKVVHPNKK